MKKRFLMVLALVCAGIAQADNFTWSGGDTGDWNGTGNWTKMSGSSTRKYPSNKADNATFGKSVAVRFTGNGTVGTITLNGDVTFTGGKYLSVNTGVNGTGTLTLSGASLRAATTGEIPIDLPLVMADGTENELQNTISSTVKAYFAVNGPLRGKGTVSIHATSATTAAKVGSILKGDNSAFGGTVRIYPYWVSTTSNQQYDQPKIQSALATSASASWEFNVEHASYGKLPLSPGTEFFGTPNETYKFGALKANFYYNGNDNAYWAAAGITLEVGGKNLDSYVKGVCAPKDGIIDWVAVDATFTNEVSQLACLRLSGGGKVVIGAAEGVPTALTFANDGGELRLASGVTADLSAKFMDSTAPIVFNDQGVNHTWATGLDKSNTGGFVKRGAGTLTWSAPPAAPIDVTIEQGVLVVPFGTTLGRVVVADGAVLKVDVAGQTKGVALVVTSSDRPLVDPLIQFLNAPTAPTAIWGENYGVSYVLGSDNYVWRGPTANANWSTPANWDPSDVPAMADTATFTNRPAAAVTVDQAAGALSAEGAGGLSLGGSYLMSLSSFLTLAGDLTLTPNPMSGETGADAYNAANRLGVKASALSARAVAGEGIITAPGSDLSGMAEAGTTNGFVGSLEARDFTKRGAGVYKLIGESKFSGTLAIEEGTLLVGTYRDLDNIRFDFDASDVASLGHDTGHVSSWTSAVGGYRFDYDGGQQAMMTTAYFGGKNALQFRPAEGAAYSRYALTPDNATSGCASKSLFMVYQLLDNTAEEHYYGMADVGGLYHNKTSHILEWMNAASATGKKGIFNDDAYGSLIIGVEPHLVCWSDTLFDMSAGKGEYLGTQGGAGITGIKGVIAEVVAFTNTLTHVEREVTTKTLMCKWGLGYADYKPLSSTVAVTMKAGATLDLGGQTLDVASFEGAGVVTNGVLQTMRFVQKGGALAVPAVAGATYAMSKIGETLVVYGAAGKSVTIKVPRDWPQAGCSGKMAVFCEGNITWDFSEWYGTKPVPVSEGDGWWTIPAGGTAIRLR